MDAARGEVFAARYRAGRATQLFGVRAVGEPVSARPAGRRRGVAADGPPVSHWIGDGVLRYREHVARGRVRRSRRRCLAPLVARLGTLAAGAGLAGAPHALRPIYVRPPDVELAREGEPGVMDLKARAAVEVELTFVPRQR